MESTGPPSECTRDDVHGALTRAARRGAPVTADEIADELECPRPAARDCLGGLVEAGELETRELTDGTRVWWQSTDRAPTESRAAEREEFSAFVSAVSDYAIFKLDPDGVVASWNEGAKRIKGYEEADIVGEHFSTFYTDDDVAAGVPDGNLETAVAEGRVEDEGWRVRKDGTRFWGNVTITAIRDDDGELRGFTKVTRDMTERREHEQQLQRERNFSEQILKTVPIGICLVTPDGEVSRANQRLLDLLGVEADALSEFDVTSWALYDEAGELVPAEERPWARATETGDPVFDYHCQVDLPGVGRRWLSLSGAPVRSERHEQDPIVLAADDINDQKEREQRLRREFEQTRKLLRTAPIAIAVQNAAGETIMANQRAQDALGISEQEFLDNSDVGDEWAVYDADGEPLPDDEKPAARVLETGEPVYTEELTVESPRGDRQQFRVNAAPVLDSDGAVERVITAGEDITELKERERELERRKSELETQLSEILGRISDAFYALDDEWRFTHLNDRAAEIMQQPREELLGKRVWNVFPEATEEVFWDEFHAAMDTQEPRSFEVAVDDLDAWLGFNVYPSESGLSIYFRDVTEQKEYERRLEESNERLEQFAYAASHDLQEPLRMVSSYLQLIERRYGDDLDEAGHEFIEFAVDGADRMRDMIEGLLEYSRVETQGEAFEPVDLETVLDDVRENLQVKIDETDADLAATSLPRVRGDESQLRQLFQNLLSNAIEYSGDEPPRVRVSAERTGQTWTVSVADEGIGIDPEDRERIFEVFQSLHPNTERSGTGIGLALCKRIVERHGGDIWVESTPGDGAIFSVALPAARGVDDE